MEKHNCIASFEDRVEDFDFLDLFETALQDTLDARALRVISLRYGFDSGESMTLSEISQIYGLSRERIRQIVQRSIKKVYVRGRRQQIQSLPQSACSLLLSIVESTIRPSEEGHLQRLVEYAHTCMNHLPPDVSISLLMILSNVKSSADKEIISRERQKRRSQLRQQKRQRQIDRCKERYLRNYERLFAYVIWPRSASMPTQLNLEDCRSARRVSIHDESYSGNFYSKKLKREVEYESKTELQFFENLERAKDVIWYQEQPFAIPYTFLGESANYFPDVLVALRNDQYVVVEVKPYFHMPLSVNMVKWNALKKYCANHGWGSMMTDGRFSIQEIQAHPVNPQYQADVLARLQSGSLTWPEYKTIKDRHSISIFDFLALVLSRNLRWFLEPFTLSLSQD